VAASKIPWNVAPAPITTAPGTSQKTFSARAPPERKMLVLPACERVLATWKTQADAKKSQHIGGGVSEIMRTICRAARDSKRGWNTNCARKIVDSRSKGLAGKVA